MVANALCTHSKGSGFQPYDYGLRWYHPGQGRFINRDLIGEAGGLNLYEAFGGDPVNRFDVLGLNASSHNSRPRLEDADSENQEIDSNKTLGPFISFHIPRVQLPLRGSLEEYVVPIVEIGGGFPSYSRYNLGGGDEIIDLCPFPVYGTFPGRTRTTRSDLGDSFRYPFLNNFVMLNYWVWRAQGGQRNWLGRTWDRVSGAGRAAADTATAAGQWIGETATAAAQGVLEAPAYWSDFFSNSRITLGMGPGLKLTTFKNGIAQVDLGAGLDFSKTVAVQNYFDQETRFQFSAGAQLNLGALEWGGSYSAYAAQGAWGPVYYNHGGSFNLIPRVSNDYVSAGWTGVDAHLLIFKIRIDWKD